MKKLHSYMFLVSVVVMMAVYLSCDIFDIWDSRPLKFATSAVITLFGLTALRQKQSRFVSIGLMFTLLADIFLVLLNKYLYGVAIFIVAQLCYAVYITYISDKTVYKELLKRVIPATVAAVVCCIVGFKGNIVLPAAYGVCIGINIAHSAELYVKKPCRRHLMLMVGFIIFVCGDICVGLRHMPFITENIASVLYLITWISYPPSQLLVLASSGAFGLTGEVD